MRKNNQDDNFPKGQVLIYQDKGGGFKPFALVFWRLNVTLIIK